MHECESVPVWTKLQQTLPVSIKIKKIIGGQINVSNYNKEVLEESAAPVRRNAGNPKWLPLQHGCVNGELMVTKQPKGVMGTCQHVFEFSFVCFFYGWKMLRQESKRKCELS